MSMAHRTISNQERLPSIVGLVPCLSFWLGRPLSHHEKKSGKRDPHTHAHGASRKSSFRAPHAGEFIAGIGVLLIRPPASQRLLFSPAGHAGERPASQERPE